MKGEVQVIADNNAAAPTCDMSASSAAWKAISAATGELVAQCIDRGLTLETLPLEDYRAVCDLFDQDVYHKINLDTCVATRISEGGPCPESVERQIGKVQAFLDKYPL